MLVKKQNPYLLTPSQGGGVGANSNNESWVKMYDTNTLPIKTSRVAASGEVAAQAGRALGMYVMQSGSAGSVVLKDGGAGGTVLGTWDTMVSAEPINIPFPGSIDFSTDLYAVLTDVLSIVVYYD